MFNYKINKRDVLTLLISLLFLAPGSALAELYDMGEIGFYESVDIRSIQSSKNKLQRKIDNIHIEPREIVMPEKTLALTPVFLEKARKANVRTIKFNNPISLKKETVILFFNPQDLSCASKLKGLRIDAAYCVNTADPKDIQNFWQQVGQYPPTQVAGRELLKSLSVSCYPSMVKVKGDYIEITEGL